MEKFEVDPKLSQDTYPILDWPFCRVLRMNDSQYPWLILVPRRAMVSEVMDLTDGEQSALWSEVTRAAQILRQATNAHKMNIAALGNVVRQLHVHVIARFADDPAWPRPIWGIVPAKPFEKQAAAIEVQRWRAVLS